ncbi:MAG: pyridoxamine 5'-phosphate oxidase, partial [Gemmatimonadota bacterium]
KGYEDAGFVFYTNLGSPKARALRHTPRAALTIYWESVRRQVRARGDVESVTDEEAEAYFAQRPRGSQIGAWASEQSAPAGSREELDRRFREARERFGDTEQVPRPPFWSGFRIRPLSVEFWQEGPDRMHDRFRYERRDDGWEVMRLFP